MKQFLILLTIGVEVEEEKGNMKIKVVGNAH